MNFDYKYTQRNFALVSETKIALKMSISWQNLREENFQYIFST